MAKTSMQMVEEARAVVLVSVPISHSNASMKTLSRFCRRCLTLQAQLCYWSLFFPILQGLPHFLGRQGRVNVPHACPG